MQTERNFIDLLLCLSSASAAAINTASCPLSMHLSHGTIWSKLEGGCSDGVGAGKWAPTSPIVTVARKHRCNKEEERGNSEEELAVAEGHGEVSSPNTPHIP